MQEDKVLLFPQFDSVSLGLAADKDARRQQTFEKKYPDKQFNIYDSLEDCVMEVEELKNELSTIVMTKTPQGTRDHWSTPEVKLGNGKKGRLRKDRYSAIVMANMIARQLNRVAPPIEYEDMGGLVSDITKTIVQFANLECYQ